MEQKAVEVLGHRVAMLKLHADALTDAIAAGSIDNPIRTGDVWDEHGGADPDALTALGSLLGSLPALTRSVETALAVLHRDEGITVRRIAERVPGLSVGSAHRMISRGLTGHHGAESPI